MDKPELCEEKIDVPGHEIRKCILNKNHNLLVPWPHHLPDKSFLPRTYILPQGDRITI